MTHYKDRKLQRYEAKAAQLEDEINELQTDLYGPNFFVGRSQTVTRSAAVVVPVIVDLFHPRSVLDVGCGQGEWMEAFGLEDVYGVDIAAPDGDRFMRHDLRWPLVFERSYDLVLSLETGEHLPKASANMYVSSLVRHSRTIVFSAAVVGQEGIGHINCQPHEFWHEKFDGHGYDMLDVIRPYIRHPDVSPWYRDNTFAYVAR